MPLGDVDITVLETLQFEGDIELVLRGVGTMGHRFFDLRLRDTRSGRWGNGITLPADRAEDLRIALKEVDR